MAACRLAIRLDDSEARSGGAPITGVVVVQADKQVNCKGLQVRTIWSTHGRGNIDTGEVASQILFEGTWQAGQEYSYPFTLATAVWPPTFYGNYINVGNYVTAQAKLAWATDPKAEVEYRVIANDAPDDLKPTTAQTKQSGIIVGVILGLIGLLFVFAFIPLLVVVALVLGPIAGLIYLFKVVLPKRITGPVTCELVNAKIRAGENLQASLVFTPARNSTINGIEWKIRCAEECVSGSGSNRKTHTYELFEETISSSGTRQLKSGERQAFDLNFQLPATAAPSLKFSDNKLTWTVTARIDIPKWPDWTKTLEPIVLAVPTTQPPVLGGKAIGLGRSGSANPSTAKTLGDEAWLKQVVTQLQQNQHEEDALQVVLNAVKDFEFPIVVTLQEEIDTPEFADDLEFDRWDDAEWWAAYCPALNIDVALGWEDGYPIEVEANKTWQGVASIVGYNAENQQLLMCVTSQPEA